MPYKTALKAAIALPTIISAVVLCGKDPRCSSLVPDISTLEIKIMPVKEAMTPKSFRIVNLSTPNMAPNINVHTPYIETSDSEERIDGIASHTACGSKDSCASNSCELQTGKCKVICLPPSVAVKHVYQFR